jgi:hypothetical protein
MTPQFVNPAGVLSSKGGRRRLAGGTQASAPNDHGVYPTRHGLISQPVYWRGQDEGERLLKARRERDGQAGSRKAGANVDPVVEFGRNHLPHGSRLHQPQIAVYALGLLPGDSRDALRGSVHGQTCRRGGYREESSRLVFNVAAMHEFVKSPGDDRSRMLGVRGRVDVHPLGGPLSSGRIDSGQEPEVLGAQPLTRAD